MGGLAERLGGRLEGGDASLPIRGVGGLEDAGPDQLSFLGNAKYLRIAERSHAGAILVPSGTRLISRQGALVIVENPSKAFADACALFAPPPLPAVQGIHPRAIVAETAEIGAGAAVGPGAVIEAGAVIGAGTRIGANTYIGHEARLGERCVLYPNVTVRERCLIGNDVILHSGAVIGADGFGFDLGAEGAVKIPQTGTVRLDDRVEVGANTTIDRARFGQTWIQEGVKIDNLVMIAHNVVVGKHSVIVSQAGISGSTVIGERVIIAGQAGLVGHIRIGDRAVITAQAGVSKDVPSGEMVSGHHARPTREAHRIEALVRRLPEIVERLAALERRAADKQGKEA